MSAFNVFCKFALAAAHFVLLPVLMMAPVAAEVLHLQCEVSAHAGDLFRYQLRPKPGLVSVPLPVDCFQRGWEDDKKNVLTLDSKVDSKRVQNLTDWTMDLKGCLDYARFTAQCSEYVEAICRPDCSSLSQPFLADPPNKNLKIIAASVVAAIVGSVAAVLLVWKLLIPCVRRRKEQRIQAIRGLPVELNLEDPENPFANIV